MAGSEGRRRGPARDRSGGRRPKRGAGDVSQGVGSVILDPEARIVSWSLAAEQLTGRSAADLVGRPFSELCPGFGIDKSDVKRAADESAEIAVVVHCGDGVERPYRLSISPTVDVSGGKTGHAVIMRPGAGAAEAPMALSRPKRSTARGSTLHALEAPALLVDRADSRIIDHNEAAAAILGRKAADLSGSALDDVLGRSTPAGSRDGTDDAIEVDTALIREKRSGGRSRAYSVAIVPILTEGRELALCVFHEVTRWVDLEAELSRTNRELSKMARHDHLTGLFNKPMFQDTLSLANTRLERQSGLLGVLYIDLDGFKPVNDRFGHEFGDRVLAEVGRRLRGAVRRSDVVGRLGGDEFAAILENLRRPEDALRVGRHIIDTIGEPVQLDGETVVISASIGAVVTAEKVADSASLLVQADALMYRAKAEGHGRVALGEADEGRGGCRIAPIV